MNVFLKLLPNEYAVDKESVQRHQENDYLIVFSFNSMNYSCRQIIVDFLVITLLFYLLHNRR